MSTRSRGGTSGPPSSRRGARATRGSAVRDARGSSRSATPSTASTTRHGIPTPEPSDGPGQEEEDQQEEEQVPLLFGKRKRNYHDVAEAFRAPKRARRDCRGLMEPYQLLGKYLQRCIDIEPDIYVIVKVGMALCEDFANLDNIKSFTLPKQEIDDFDEEHQDKLYGMFIAMLDYESDFESLLQLLVEHNDVEAFNGLLDEIVDKRTDARRDDLSTLKSRISHIINPNPTSIALDPPLNETSRSKSDRGVNHPLIAALWCPRKYHARMLKELKAKGISLLVDGAVSEDEDDDEEGDETLEEDEEVDEEENEEENEQQEGGNGQGEEEVEEGEKPKRIPKDTTVVDYIQEGGIQLTADGLDAYLYDFRLFKPGNTLKAKLSGFLRSPSLVKSFRTIFKGASSMLEDQGQRTRKSNAELHGLTSVSPEAVGYTVVLTRFTMSTVESYRSVDEDYDLNELYYLVVALLSNPDSLFAQKTLKWWNKQIFPKKKLKNKRVVSEKVVPGASQFSQLVTADSARAQKRVEELARQAAEAKAKEEALERLRLQREARAQAQGAGAGVGADEGNSNGDGEGDGDEDGEDSGNGDGGGDGGGNGQLDLEAASAAMQRLDNLDTELGLDHRSAPRGSGGRGGGASGSASGRGGGTSSGSGRGGGTSGRGGAVSRPPAPKPLRVRAR